VVMVAMTLLTLAPLLVVMDTRRTL
jgi:hypothetical protein